MNKGVEILEVYLDADWRSHGKRDELIASKIAVAIAISGCIRRE